MYGGSEEREVVVVGGGPAGAAVAARLAGAGHDVLVLDRAHFPRRKPCGECVNPAGVDALHSLGALERVLAAGPARLEGWRISTSSGASFDGSFPQDRPGFALPRAVLDSLLLEHAVACGADVLFGARAVGLVSEGGWVRGVRIREAPGGAVREVRARLVIGADGIRSVVARAVGAVRRAPRLRKLALTAHVRGIDGPPARGELRTRGVGCMGIADVGDGTANVTVVVPQHEARSVAGDVDGFFDRALARYGVPHARRVDRVLATGPFDWPVRTAAFDGALLVGDAAGYFDPFTGQGIFRALRGAELASTAASAALREGDASAAALRPYERERRRAFSAGERLQRGIEAVISREAVFERISRRLARHPAVADAVVAVTGDLRPVRSLLEPRIFIRLFAGR